MSVAKRKTRATLGRKYMGKPTGMHFRGDDEKEGNDEDPTMVVTTKRKKEECAFEIKMIRFRYQLDSFAPTDEPAKNVMQSAFLLTEVATMLGLHASPGVNVGLLDSPR
ncbi:hypothetical protein ALC53_03985 [Atta colombica]|uniref:Uncharacterized protein n=1 Tax=Atta colombica TaxID=520822 RepID=A0A195BMW4_9HYME|nr:hypothetical protein ALC53_03985 [Atta colombica]